MIRPAKKSWLPILGSRIRLVPLSPYYLPILEIGYDMKPRLVMSSMNLVRCLIMNSSRGFRDFDSYPEPFNRSSCSSKTFTTRREYTISYLQATDHFHSI